MNANELANYIEDEYLNGMECEHGFLVFENGGCPNEGRKRQDFYKAATMLRQQQAEIAELETGLKNVWKVVEGKQTEIEALKDEVAEWKMSYENSIRFEDGYGHN